MCVTAPAMTAQHGSYACHTDGNRGIGTPGPPTPAVALLETARAAGRRMPAAGRRHLQPWLCLQLPPGLPGYSEGTPLLGHPAWQLQPDARPSSHYTAVREPAEQWSCLCHLERAWGSGTGTKESVCVRAQAGFALRAVTAFGHPWRQEKLT